MFKNLEKNELTSVNYTSIKKQNVRDIPLHFRSSILIKARDSLPVANINMATDVDPLMSDTF